MSDLISIVYMLSLNTTHIRVPDWLREGFSTIAGFMNETSDSEQYLYIHTNTFISANNQSEVVDMPQEAIH